jgi:membrane protease YdiL (CAAX protease family)
MSKKRSMFKVSIIVAIFLTLAYEMLKVAIAYGLFKIFTPNLEDINLQIEINELISSLFFIILLLIVFKKTIYFKEPHYSSIINIRLIVFVIFSVIAFRLIQDPIIRFKNIFLNVALLDTSQITPISFSYSLLIRSINTVILLPVFEELMFRKIIFGGLLKKYDRFWTAALTSSILFALIHLSVIGFLINFFFGIFSCYLFYKTKNIKYSILFHVLSNLLWLILLVNTKQYFIFIEKLNFSFLYWFLIIFGIGIIVIVISQYRKLSFKKN